MGKPPVTWGMRFLLAGLGTMAALTLVSFCYVIYFLVIGEMAVATLPLLGLLLSIMLMRQCMRFVRLQRESDYAKMEAR